MRSKESHIIRFLIEHKTEELNIFMISKSMKMDYKNVYSIIKRLEKASLVRIETFGKSNRIKLNTSSHPLIFEAEFERRKESLKDKNLQVMFGIFRGGIKSKLYVLLLFGSYANKKQTKNSDIDLMFICSDGLEDAFEKDANRIARSIPLSLHPLVFSESQFLEMINAKEPNVGQEALKNNVILYGMEQFYEMI
ncbi:MAG: nucleotidyltransferase domain-containing protein [Nanoarchaeota archaeon]|nr:nucleotidyltransferase domain-containing protein [Nanoarchaeota archaeon]MBU1005089.1 nucleotidyltransferase domain-containing protein [Nanoarchaeota archaeon]MBU1946431.1 nucleotidyltransferase domain-containing protein [Nanoarchaeota archaeon]